MKFLATLALVMTLGGCSGHLSSVDRSELEAYQAQGGACIAANPGNKAAQDACIASARADWCAKWKARFDAGVCQ